jgi:hypothetical protein
MGEIKISVSDKLDNILQKEADRLGIKKAQLVKHVVVSHVSELNEFSLKKGEKKN